MSKLFLSLLGSALALSLQLSGDMALPEKAQKIMQQPKYAHANWGIIFQDTESIQPIYSLNADKMYLPGSTTKMFSVAALLDAYGEDYRFDTPLYAIGKIDQSRLDGNLVLVGQGDLTFGGRQPNSDTIAFTKMDHSYANMLPDASLTPENPLHAFNALAKQVKAKGINQIDGTVLIDDRLFEAVTKRDFLLSPIMVNENLIDLLFNPTTTGEMAALEWRPQVPGYSVENRVKTVSTQKEPDIKVTTDEDGKSIIVEGELPVSSKNILRTAPIKDPSGFAKLALIQALRQNGIAVNEPQNSHPSLPSSYQSATRLAVWQSPPLSEYGKLILKVSDNIGADLIPILLAVKQGQKTFDDGMVLLADYLIKKVGLSPDSFVFLDGAGGDSNRIVPEAAIKLLNDMVKAPFFSKYKDGFPVLGVDGSMEDFGKKTPAAGHVFTKPGTGIAYNEAIKQYFLYTQALGGYLQGRNGHLYSFMVVVNNAPSPKIEDVFGFFEDLSQIVNEFYINIE